MNCYLFIPAQIIIADFQTKKLSAINLLEDIIVQNFPHAIQTNLLTCIKKEEHDENNPDIVVDVRLNNQLLLQIKLDTNFQGNTTVLKNVSNIGAIIISEPGILKFDVRYNNGSINEYSVQIRGNNNPVVLPIAEEAVEQP